ncbi:hypothetical protein GOP47_0010761 [Adiantum capillus-veneris]|uniref:Transmembrane protein n=1 Tax=Adiantum capillus-veneris TaxID=13818 RepID=A0A9D4ZJ38_ADICA|nr:hypothetical protein GOP47_0010761 [Adiantum capillus-veneris]
MDCCPAAGVRHGVGTGACLKETQPLPVRPHQLLRVPASPKTQGCKCSMRSYGVSSFSQAVGADRVPSSPRILASRHANTSTTANNLPENEALSSNADCNTSNYNERNRGQNGAGNTTFTQLPSRVNSTNCSISEYQTSMEESSKLSTAKISNNGRAGSTSCADDISSPSVDSTRKSGSDDQNENTSLPASLTDEMTKPGPLMEIHNHVADEQKESGMPQRQRRAFYSHEDWLRHRSSLRYVRHVLSSVSSRVIVSLVPPVFTFTAGAIGVAAYNTALKYGYLPSFLPLLHAASLPYELTAPALALLLVFRTDASYSRYDEARKTWTSVISTTKDLARLSAQLIKSPQDVALKSSLLSYIMAFPVSLKCHLIYGSDTPSELQRLLQHDDLAFVLKSQHRPNCLIQLISQAMDLLHLEKTDRVLLTFCQPAVFMHMLGYGIILV